MLCYDRRVKSLGGMERLKTMLDDLNSASRRALLSMGSIDESIGREERKIDTTQLEKKLHDMADVVEGRDKLVKALKEIVDINITEVSSNIISSSTHVNYLEAIAAVHKDNLEKAQSIYDEINKGGVTVQEKLLSEIIMLNDLFVKARGNNPIEVEKNKVIARIDENITKYMSIHAQMTAGFTFYSGLQVVIVDDDDDIDVVDDDDVVDDVDDDDDDDDDDDVS